MANDALASFSALLKTELETEEQRTAKAVLHLEYEFSNRSAFHGSARVLATAECLGGSLVRYRQCVFERWTTYIRPRLDALPEADRAACANAALTAMDDAIASSSHVAAPMAVAGMVQSL